jgi:3-phosphoshikimate 1-carboxyvinyltransferase
LKAILVGNVKLRGEIKAPPSKSYSHRAIIASSLSEDQSFVGNPLEAEDVEATIRACRSFGAEIFREKQGLRIKGNRNLKAPSKPINCGESASTLRFLIPIAALAEGQTILTGVGSLLKRPVKPVVEALKFLGVPCESREGYPPVKVKGPSLKGGKVSLPGNISSQFFSGLLFACPLAEKETLIEVKGKLESKPYVNLTLHVLSEHLIRIEKPPDYRWFRILGGQTYKGRNYKIPGDYSSASFLLAASALAAEPAVKISGLNLKLETQPDIGILKIIQDMGVKVKFGENWVEVQRSELEAVEVDASDIPDLVPVIAVLACYARGTTRIMKAGRLRIKESDRLSALSSELSKMGAKILEKPDGLEVSGPYRLRGTIVDSHSDHRIAMACSVAALAAEGETIILNAECVKKSYPNFYQDLMRIGGIVRFAE